MTQNLPPGYGPSRKMGNSGMTLVEVLIVVFILGVLMTGFTETMGIVIRSLASAKNHSQTNGTAYFAVMRMVRFVKETDVVINPPKTGVEADKLTVNDRILDLVDNTTRVAGSDGILDADIDADGLVNEGTDDFGDNVVFLLDKTDADNWKLTESVPDYATVSSSDMTPPRVICDHVTEFKTQWLSQGVVRIHLSTSFDEMESTMKTRVKARLLNPNGMFP